MQSHNLFIFVIIYVLFVALTPGVLLRIPNKGSLLKQTIVHGIVFIVCVYLIHLFYMRMKEGFYAKKPQQTQQTVCDSTNKAKAEELYIKYKLHELDKKENLNHLMGVFVGKMEEINRKINASSFGAQECIFQVEKAMMYLTDFLFKADPKDPMTCEQKSTILKYARNDVYSIINKTKTIDTINAYYQSIVNGDGTAMKKEYTDFIKKHKECEIK